MTKLRLDPIGVPPYSARGITQTLEPVDGAAQLERTVNGELIDLSDSSFQKYRSTITCTDQQQPAITGAWPGTMLIVDCVATLNYLTASGSSTRPVASTTDDEATWEEGLFTFYRPRLTMRVVGWRTGVDEYGAECNWALDLEEV